MGRHFLVCGRDLDALYGALGRHILLCLRGLNLVQTAEDMRSHGERFDLVTFRRRLEERGLRIPRGAVHMSSMRLWLEKAGVVVSEDWRIRLASKILLAQPKARSTSSPVSRKNRRHTSNPC